MTMNLWVFNNIDCEYHPQGSPFLWHVFGSCVHLWGGMREKSLQRISRKEDDLSICTNKTPKTKGGVTGTGAVTKCSKTKTKTKRVTRGGG